MNKNSFTLIEIIVVASIVGFVMLSFTAIALFFIRQVNINKERTNMWSQLEYTLSDMRIRCLSAISTTTPLSSGGSILLDINNPTNTFSFEGESDIFKVTPDDSSDNATYTYRVLPANSADNSGSLVLESSDIATGGSLGTEILIDGKYNPQMELKHNCVTYAGMTVCDEPHFITVTLTLHSPKGPINISRTEGIRFWFMDVVQ